MAPLASQQLLGKLSIPKSFALALLLLLLAPVALCSASSLRLLPGREEGRALTTCTACLATCPTSPLQYCDFYFANSPTTIPTFDLASQLGQEQAQGGAVALNSATGASLTAIGSTGNGCATSPVTGVHPAGTTGQQFYATGTKFFARAFQTQAPVGNFVPNCVVLPINSAELKKGANTINLNPGDCNTLVTQARRCIVFKISGTSG